MNKDLYELVLNEDARRVKESLGTDRYMEERERLIETLKLEYGNRKTSNFDKAIEIGKVVLPLMVTTGLFFAGLAFEENGAIRSNVFRVFLRKAI